MAASPKPACERCTRTVTGLVVAAVLASAACRGSDADTAAFTSSPTSPTSLSSTDSDISTTATIDPTTSASAAGSSSTSHGESSADDSSPTSSTTLILDVGADKDLLDPKPAGCKGKIDFLFVVSRGPNMKSSQAELINAFPGFLAAIEAEFSDFDQHIMVVDGDAGWGVPYCTDDCPALTCKVGEPCCPLSAGGCEGCIKDGDPCCQVPDYPCALLDQVTACDAAIGAGNVFQAGEFAANTPCPIASGHRYLTKSEPALGEAFACVAELGISGRDHVGEALAAAMQPGINGPGGCNEGFLRDDALLMVTLISGYDYDSAGTPEAWADAVIAAKNGDPEAVVVFNLGNDPTCEHDYDRLCWFTSLFPHSLHVDSAMVDWAQAFASAAQLVDVACESFIPM